jgi:excisionase family DNA binding protein
MTTVSKPKWFAIKDAADYLDVGEPTLYRWIREGKITYRKVGDSIRFLQEDLEGMVQVHRSAVEVDKAQQTCPSCHGTDLVEGHVQSTGACYFRPLKTKFWVFQDANVETRAWMCTRCGQVTWFGDVAKLLALRTPIGDVTTAPQTAATEPDA